jgi:uncharacterized membrane protein
VSTGSAPKKKLSLHSVLVLALVLAYPVLAYVSIDNLGIRMASLVLLVLLLGSTLVRMVAVRALWRPLLLQAAAVGLILGAGYVTRSPFYMKLVPALIALSASANFFLSLRKVPVIESIARMQKPELPPDEVRYTRTWTHLWGWTMAADAVICLAAAMQDSLKLWLILCFPVSYVLIGLVFCTEYVIRKKRFGEYNDALIWDRIIKRLLKK